jgi:hypothetical protein
MPHGGCRGTAPRFESELSPCGEPRQGPSCTVAARVARLVKLLVTIRKKAFTDFSGLGQCLLDVTGEVTVLVLDWVS